MTMTLVSCAQACLARRFRNGISQAASGDPRVIRSAPAAPHTAMNISGYQIERRIGQGGMALVYLAMQESLRRPVALKVLHPLHAETPEFTERFLNEGRMLASLSHRNIIIIHDIGVSGPVHYIAMEYVEGGDLKQRIREGLSVPLALEYARTIACALHVAHQKGIVHRDVKPANVMFRNDGTLVLTDFGIAKQFDANSDLTVTGSTIGSPHYLSPEQAHGKPVDARADIYSIGIMLYEMLSGEKPYQGESEMDTVLKHLSEPVPQLAGDLAQLQPLLERMLAKQPEDRFQSAAELAERLAAARDAWAGEEEPTAPAPEALSAGESVSSETTVELQAPSVVPEPGERAGRGGWLIPVFVGTAIGIAIVVGVLLAGRAYLDELWSPSAPAAAARSVPAAPTTAAGDRPPLPSSAETAAASSAPSGASAGAPPDGMGEPPVDAGAQAVPAPAVVFAPAATRESVSPPAASRAVDPNAAKIASLLASANRAIDDFRLTRPAGNSAIDFIEQVLKMDSANEDARAAFKRIAERYAVLARTRLGKSDYTKARLYVDRGLEVDAGNVDLQALDAELASRPTAAVDESGVATSAREPAASETGEIQGESPTELFNRIKGFFSN